MCHLRCPTLVILEPVPSLDSGQGRLCLLIGTIFTYVLHRLFSADAIELTVDCVKVLDEEARELSMFENVQWVAAVREDRMSGRSFFRVKPVFVVFAAIQGAWDGPSKGLARPRSAKWTS